MTYELLFLLVKSYHDAFVSFSAVLWRFYQHVFPILMHA